MRRSLPRACSKQTHARRQPDDGRQPCMHSSQSTQHGPPRGRTHTLPCESGRTPPIAGRVQRRDTGQTRECEAACPRTFVGAAAVCSAQVVDGAFPGAQDGRHHLHGPATLVLSGTPNTTRRGGAVRRVGHTCHGPLVCWASTLGPAPAHVHEKYQCCVARLLQGGDDLSCRAFAEACAGA